MAGWINSIKGIITRVRKSIPGQWIVFIRHKWIRLSKPPQRRVIPAGLVKHQPQLGAAHVAVLPGKRVLRGQRATAVPRLAPGFVQLRHGRRRVRAVGEAGAAEMIA